MLGDNFRRKFWYNLWCGDNALKDSFPLVFKFAREKEALVANCMDIYGDLVQWNVNFTRAAQD